MTRILSRQVEQCRIESRSHFWREWSRTDLDLSQMGNTPRERADRPPAKHTEVPQSLDVEVRLVGCFRRSGRWSDMCSTVGHT